MLRFLNGSSSLLSTMAEGPRADRRKNMTVPVLVIPLKKKRLVIDRVFAATTRDVSAHGVSLIVRDPGELDEVVLAFRVGASMEFVVGKARHLTAIPAGFYQLGLQILRIVHPRNYPELEAIRF
jgi:hypothetical protein